MESLHKRLGPCAMVRDLVEPHEEGILQSNPYENKSQNAKMFLIMDIDQEVIPKSGEEYVNADTLPPKRDRMARSRVVHQNQDTDSNPISRSNQNPILDTCFLGWNSLVER